jgi:NAD(P)-dependent dehydrogenase (short-subunit alcohol dehydrogenase family)
MKLKGLNAVVTGGSRGLGKAIAEEFLREGSNVFICAREPEILQAARSELQTCVTGDQKICAQACDVSSEHQVNELISAAMSQLGSIDILVANAGVYGPMGPTETVDFKEWMRAVEINLCGMLLPCRAVIPHFKKAGYGKIIVISGGGATNPLPNISSYAASKAAVARLTETLAEELKPFHVDVNAVAPGALNTRLIDEVLKAGPGKVGKAFYEKNQKWASEGATPLSLGARLCAYLASPASDGITGKLISAQWDPWAKLHEFRGELVPSDIYCLRRIVPEDRGKSWQ